MGYEIRDTCHKGHLYTEENTRFHKNRDKLKKVCMICQRNQPAKLRKKAEVAAKRKEARKVISLDAVRSAREAERKEIFPNKGVKKHPTSARTHMDRKDFVEILRKTPLRSREELESLKTPPDIHSLCKQDRDLIYRGRSGKNIDWGLLGNYYPIHRSSFVAIKSSRRVSKSPLPTDFLYTAEDFLEFILEVGIPDKEYKNPAILLIEREKGYVCGNFEWGEKPEKGPNSSLPEAEIPHVIFEGRKYYETTYSGQKEHVWNRSSSDPIELWNEVGIKRRFLRSDVWLFYFGSPPTNRTPTYKDLDGDMTDPFNLKLIIAKSGHKGKRSAVNSYGSEQTERERKLSVRQALADIATGCIKICLGCYGEWRIMGDKVLVLREGIPEKSSLCEEKHIRSKGMEKWTSATEAYRAGHRFQHANLTKSEEEDEDNSESTSGYVPLL